jgi:hypothetical protein
MFDINGQFSDLFESTKKLSERFSRVDEQGGKVVRPIQIEDGNTLESTMDEDWDEDLEPEIPDVESYSCTKCGKSIPAAEDNSGYCEECASEELG